MVTSISLTAESSSCSFWGFGIRDLDPAAKSDLSSCFFVRAARTAASLDPHLIAVFLWLGQSRCALLMPPLLRLSAGSLAPSQHHVKVAAELLDERRLPSGWSGMGQSSGFASCLCGLGAACRASPLILFHL